MLPAIKSAVAACVHAQRRGRWQRGSNSEVGSMMMVTFVAHEPHAPVEEDPWDSSPPLSQPVIMAWM